MEDFPVAKWEVMEDSRLVSSPRRSPATWLKVYRAASEKQTEKRKEKALSATEVKAPKALCNITDICQH